MAATAMQRWLQLRGVRAVVRLQRAQRLASSAPLPHAGSFNASDCCVSMSSLDDLEAVPTGEKTLGSLVRRATRTGPITPELHFWPVAIMSIVLAMMCVVPYNYVLLGDPGSPLLVSFGLHVAIVVLYIPRAHTMLLHRKIPFSYHAGMVVLGCLFTNFKADAFVRLPASVCMLLSNMQMVIGVIVQFVLSGKHYSGPQISGVALVTAGVVWAGHVMQHDAHQRDAAGQTRSGYLLGVSEMLLASLALVLLGHVVKVAFSRFGESVEEQIFVQHFFSLLIIFPSQWDKIGPRVQEWADRKDMWLFMNLLVCVVLNMAARAATVQMSGRAPTLLMTQLVHTLEHFLQLFTLAFLRVPPWPPTGFWTGTLVLAIGTVQYLRASREPKEINADKVDLDEERLEL